jgi:cytochrome c oxidase subunit 3
MSNVTTASTKEAKWWNGGKSPFDVEYGKVMMWYFLMSDAFTFGAFLISYGTVRFSTNGWPDPNKVFKSFPFAPEGVNAPLVFVSVMTFILIVSSVTMVLAVHAGKMMDKKGVVRNMIWTIIGGIAFLGCQAWEWTQFIHEGGRLDSNLFGFTPTAAEHAQNLRLFDHVHWTEADKIPGPVPFASLFFIVTGFHGFHVLSGVVINIIIWLNVIRGTYEKRGHYEMVEKVGLYWHFVDLVWVFVFTFYYLI